MLRLRVRGARVPTPAAAMAVRPPRRLLRKAAAAWAAVCVLVRLHGADAAFYGFLAAAWVGGFVGGVLMVLGRWVLGQGSAAEAAGESVFAGSRVVMVCLLPAFAPLFMTRSRQRVEFEANREIERRRKLQSNNIVAGASANEQCQEKNVAPLLLIMMATTYMFSLLGKIIHTANMMKRVNEEGSLMWSVGSVLYGVAWLVVAVLVGFVAVPSMLILVTVPRANDGHTLMY